jgi:putative aldouronate transport system permease protein
MAYPLTKSSKEFRGRNIYMNLLIFAMLFNGGMIPSFILVKELGLLNTIWALILPGALPIFSVILLMNFFLGIPKSMEEAAIIDGAGPLQVLLKILLPCAKPCLATIALFSVVGSWNDFYSGLIYIQRPKNYPIMTYIQSLNVDIQEMLRSGMNSSALQNITELSNKNLNAAKIVVAVIPLLVIYPILQKYLITGIVMGSVKE